MDTINISDVVRRLRENPTDTQLLDAVLTFLEQQERAYFRPGDLYLVPVPGTGMVTKELATVGDQRCHLRCLGLGCPGVLKFRDGTEVCPYTTTVRKAVATDPFVIPLQLVQRLLYRGVTRGSVELFDGRTITFNIRPAKSSKDVERGGSVVGSTATG